MSLSKDDTQESSIDQWSETPAIQRRLSLHALKRQSQEILHLQYSTK
jgi:hypothetical protein